MESVNYEGPVCQEGPQSFTPPPQLVVTPSHAASTGVVLEHNSPLPLFRPRSSMGPGVGSPPPRPLLPPLRHHWHDPSAVVVDIQGEDVGSTSGLGASPHTAATSCTTHSLSLSFGDRRATMHRLQQQQVAWRAQRQQYLQPGAPSPPGGGLGPGVRHHQWLLQPVSPAPGGGSDSPHTVDPVMRVMQEALVAAPVSTRDVGLAPSSPAFRSHGPLSAGSDGPGGGFGGRGRPMDSPLDALAAPMVLPSQSTWSPGAGDFSRAGRAATSSGVGFPGVPVPVGAGPHGSLSSGAPPSPVAVP